MSLTQTQSETLYLLLEGAIQELLDDPSLLPEELREEVTALDELCAVIDQSFEAIAAKVGTDYERKRLREITAR